MAARAHRVLTGALIRTFKVPNTKTATKGMRVKFSGADDQVENCGAAENGFGIALTTVVGSTSLPTVEVVLEGTVEAEVLVGTGGATRGENAVMAADGFTNKTLGGGTTVAHAAGKFMQTGVAGDYVSLLIGGPVSSVSA